MPSALQDFVVGLQKSEIIKSNDPIHGIVTITLVHMYLLRFWAECLNNVSC